MIRYVNEIMEKNTKKEAWGGALTNIWLLLYLLNVMQTRTSGFEACNFCVIEWFTTTFFCSCRQKVQEDSFQFFCTSVRHTCQRAREFFTPIDQFICQRSALENLGGWYEKSHLWSFCAFLQLANKPTNLEFADKNYAFQYKALFCC